MPSEKFGLMANAKRKRRRTAFPVLAAAGASLAIGGSASATTPTADAASQVRAVRADITQHDEEIYDASLSTFYVFDKELAFNVRVKPPHVRVKPPRVRVKPPSGHYSQVHGHPGVRPNEKKGDATCASCIC